MSDPLKRVLILIAGILIAVTVGTGVLMSRRGTEQPAPTSPELEAMLSVQPTPTPAADPGSALPGGAGPPALRVPAAGPAAPNSAAPAGTTPPASGGIRVHVVGAVKNDGVYTLPPGARVEDAVNAAGGATAKADLEAINLADFVKDAERVRIPTRAETAVPGQVRTAGWRGAVRAAGRHPDTAPAPASARQTPPGDPPPATAPGGKINVNAASAQELEALDGIGPSKAAAIVRHREEHGPFVRPEDLLDVRGIGDKIFAAIKDQVTVR